MTPGRPCRWCKAATPVIWAMTKANARPIPIEPEPNPNGNVELIDNGPNVSPTAIVHSGPPGMFDEWTPYLPHHATCHRDADPPTP